MISQSKTTMGKLLSHFRYEREQVRQAAIEKLWEQNDLSNPKRREGYEVHERLVHDKDGNTIIVVELWKRIDDKRAEIKVNVEANTIEVSDEVAELME